MLISIKKIIGFSLIADSHSWGHVSDLLFADSDGRLTHYVVATSNWLVGKQVLIELGPTSQINWARGEVYSDLTSEAMLHAPKYSQDEFMDEAFRRSVHETHLRMRHLSLGKGRGKNDYGQSRALQEEGPNGQAGFAESFEAFESGKKPLTARTNEVEGHH